MLVTRRETHAKLTAGNLKQGAALSNQNGAIVTTVRLSSGTSQQIIIPSPILTFPLSPLGDSSRSPRPIRWHKASLFLVFLYGHGGPIWFFQ